MRTNEVDAAGQEAAGEWSVTLVDEPASEALRIALAWSQDAMASIKRLWENGATLKSLSNTLLDHSSLSTCT